MAPVLGSVPRLPLSWNALNEALPSSRLGSFSMKKRTPRCHRKTSAENAVAQVRSRRR
ncbi:hypothetical protein ACVWXU_006834 [Streptomyces sp. TE33382]